MPRFKCVPITDPSANYAYCPSFGAAILFSCLFGITTVAHVIQANLYKKPFAWVLIMGGCWETGGVGTTLPPASGNGALTVSL